MDFINVFFYKNIMNKFIRDIVVGVASGAAYESLKSGCKRGIDAL